MRPFKSSVVRRCGGFSLIELAVVLLILGSLLSGLLVALSQISDNTRRANAAAQLERVEESLYGFAQAFGYLPCPATSTSDGVEDRTAGDCSVQHGFVPNVSLNLYGSINDDGLLLDPWANPLRYSVADRTSGGNASFTTRAGLQSEFNAGALDSTGMLRVCDRSTCLGDILTDTAPVIVVSMGENWPDFSSNDEVENAGGTTDGGYRITNTDDFVSTTYSEDNFDDIVLWISPFILYNRLVSASQLP